MTRTGRSSVIDETEREHRGRYKAVTVNDFRLLGLRKLHPVVRSYYESRADQEQTLRENVAAFKRLRLRPSVLVPVDKRSINTTLLEQPVSMPVGIGPTDLQMMANREGEIATAVASQKEGTVMILSAMSSIPLEKVRPNAPQGIFWQELYAFKNRTVTFEIIKRAQHAGINAFVMTLDAPTWGRRIVDERHLFITPPGISLANLQHLGGAHDVRFERMKGCGLTKYMNDFLDPSLSWKDVAWLRSVSKLPVILKGILTAEDAATAVEVGAAAVTVSNHGGRQLDGTPATIEALPEIVAAVGDRAEVYVDGGVRTGTDVIKALALGTKAVFVGRPVIWALSYDGRQGVRMMLDVLRTELMRAMALIGCKSARDLGKKDVVRQEHYWVKWAEGKVKI
ncbi:uncharacterized protein LOC119381636 [Rhipicephalus sanguineus]|uniref:uncharacterized protein LOC119381636 n=1 Tax=Rhipicephalus sanguineus TaxID=34632 RepID=UPI00189445B6|nr:uncharacterized protein LOC119381636 [Rhipicephalus sanguineus]